MELSKYEVFLKTVELGNITRAADVLGYTQPAVSRVITDLEREWGIPLLIRSRGGVKLTTEGQQLLPSIRAVCCAQRELEASVSRAAGADPWKRPHRHLPQRRRPLAAPDRPALSLPLPKH